jgi:hypothetical protein
MKRALQSLLKYLEKPQALLPWQHSMRRNLDPEERARQVIWNFQSGVRPFQKKTVQLCSLVRPPPFSPLAILKVIFKYYPDLPYHFICLNFLHPLSTGID